ncbi:MAG TPA: AAA family ATPase, partial [Pseudoxanthomonas mexicana]|nr:AAA family ATPase [Pseudoxanthomonas mexicana]
MRVWAIANQKGGVGKTTTTLALGRGLAMRGHRVLLVDLDPHASLTRAFGVATDPQPAGVLDLFDEQPPALATLARATEIENLSFIAAQTPLATLERRSATQP